MAGVELGSAFISVGLGTNKLGPEIRKAFSGVDATGSDAGKSAGKGFRLGFAGVASAAIGALGIGTFLKGAVAEASGLGESINAVNVVFGKASAGVQQLGKESAKSLGLSNLEFNNLAVRFSSFASTIAGPAGDVTGTLKSMTGRASDFASVMNLDVAEAAQLFQSGLAGESEPLRAFGIDMSAAAVEAFALEEGIAKSASSMTEAQKVQARYGLLMKQTAQTQGDFANTSGSLANQTRILSSSWKNTQATIGTLFLPVLEKTVGFIVANVMPNIDKLVASLGSGGLAGAFAPIMAVAGPVFASLAAQFGPLIPQVLQLVSSFSPLGLLFQVLTPILPMLSTAFTQISGSIAGVLAIVIPLVSQLVSSLLPIIVDLVSTVLPPLAAMFGELIAAVAPFVVQLASDLIPIVNALMPVVTTVFTVISAVIKSAMQIIQGIIRVVTGAISGDWSKVWGGLGDIVSGALNTVGTILGGLGGIVSSAVSGIGGWLVDSGRALIQGFIDGIGGMVGAIGNAVGSVLGAVADFFPHSPAKKGPFSGRGYTTYSGAALAGDFADSIRGQRSYVAAAAAAVTGAAVLSGSFVPAGAYGTAGALGAAGSGATFNTTINQVDDPIGTSHAVTRRLQSLSA